MSAEQLVSGKRFASQMDSVDPSSKRARQGDGIGQPSKVLHVRGLPQDCTEQDLMQLCVPFGQVVNVLLLKGKNQAFVQMADAAGASQLVAYYENVPATIRSRTVHFQFSTRSEISTPAPGHNDRQQQQQGPETQNSILLVTVLNVMYPVTIDVLHEVFHKCGQIMKIIIFTKNSTLQALVQFNTLESAVNAKTKLDGQNIYAGCCTLRIQYSSFNNLNVKYNNDKSRDFTDPSLPTGNMQPGGMDPHMPVYQDPSQWGGWPQGGGHPHAQLMTYPPYPAAAAAGGYPPQQAKMSGNGCVLITSGLQPGDPSRPPADCQTLFTMFGVYGDVIRVKIMYNKQDTALIQFATPQQAETAMTHVNGLAFRGNVLKVNFSKHTAISMPRAGTESEASPLTQDFTGSPLHRYKVQGSKNFQHITSPSATLHVSNSPLGVTEEQIRDLFGQCGTVVNFKFFPKDNRMFLIEMGSIEEAVEAVIALHDHKLLEQNIRVSFSKSTIQPQQ